ncbi:MULTISPECIES: ATP-binding protein [Actinomadura]|uniref:histidine kinase n=1 Tax=Actinomadura geliboluensis TaxID=882440 RepID=A0A5S4H9E1_9ACTN|nr:ATP-binding protein [Actinomadura geliboluensis]TMR41602.1 response regulator [Actinomadura geliboluensis]
MAEDLVRMEISDEEGVFTVRRAGRQVAAAVGLEHQDQVRVATALSEVGRELYACSGLVSVAFRLDPGRHPALVVELDLRPRPDAVRTTACQVAAARLVSLLEEEETAEGGVRLRLRKDLPSGAAPVGEGELSRLRARLSRLHPLPALEELQTQNTELTAALTDLQRRQEELRTLNAELEETNHGVMALYSELSEELEETNRGVVALYAELEEKSDQLREAGEAKNRFWAGISHELRTPVNGVIGLTRLLLDPSADPLTEEQRQQITLIRDTGGTLLSMVNELLDMARAEQGRLEPNPAPVDVPALLAEQAELLNPMAEQAGLSLVVDDADAPRDFVTDPEMLSRILRNLVGNGLKFTEEGGVRVSARRAGEDVEFTVADTGVGIPPDERERVFEEFHRVPGSGGTGTGLGLPFARRLARILGGDVTLDSAVGEGTTATVRLPPYRDMAHLDLGHVLIVDDDATARRTLRDLVDASADRVSEAADGTAALAAAAADPPDLVLLDLRMPGRDGYDVLAGLPTGTPVVLVTSANAAASDDPRLRRADAVLGKDRIGPESLAAAIRSAHARRAREGR